MNQDRKLSRSRSSSPSRTLQQMVFLNLQKTADALMGDLADLLKASDISPTQYNVLRILRAAGSRGLPCGQIAGRMLTREPDMTRLLDRLEKRGLIERSRDANDRRVVLGRITHAGREALKPLDQPVAELHRRQLGHMGRERLSALAELLQEARRRTNG